MELTEAERIRLLGFMYTDHTHSYHIQERDARHFKSVVEKGLVTIDPPDPKWPGILLVRLTPAGLQEVQQK